MRKEKKLEDFQISVGSAGLVVSEQKRINEALFTVYEIIRLWLKDNRIEAPFRKIAITLIDSNVALKWHGKAAIAIDVCEVTEAIELSELRKKYEDHIWIISIIRHAMECVFTTTGWRSDVLEEMISLLSKKQFPFIHRFANFVHTDGKSGIKYQLWLSTRPNETKIGIRLSKEKNGVQDIVLMEKKGPIFLEDDFPIAKMKIEYPYLLIFDVNDRELSKIALDE